MNLYKLFSRLLTATLILVIAGSFVTASYAYFDQLQDNANENVTIGDWAYDNCVKMYTAQEFYDFATSSTSLSTDNYCLANDIDFTGFNWLVTAAFNNNTFQGTFNGKGYTLSNITLNATDTTAKYLSIFSKMNGGTISNVQIDNFTMGFDSTFFANSNIQTAIFAGSVTGVNNTIENITINDSELLANSLNGAGGIVAQVEANADITITNIKARNFTVLSTSKRAGGIISRAIKGSGTVTVEDIDFQGYVAAGNATSNTGGIIGTIQNLTLNITRAVVEYTAEGTVQLSDGPQTIKAVKYVGGLIGNTQNASVITITDTFYTGILYNTYANVGTVMGRKKTTPTMTNSFYSNVLFVNTYVAPTGSTILSATIVNEQTMPSSTWWDGFKVNFDATNNLWMQDGTGRIELIRD